MTRRFNAHFQNGVLIPDEAVELPENMQLFVTVQEDSAQVNQIENRPDPADPRPAGGVALVEWRARHRLQVNEDIAKIATDPEFDIENS